MRDRKRGKEVGTRLGLEAKCWGYTSTGHRKVGNRDHLQRSGYKGTFSEKANEELNYSHTSSMKIIVWTKEAE